MGSVEEDLTAKQEDNILENYWDFMASMILLLEREKQSDSEIIETALFRQYG